MGGSSQGPLLRINLSATGFVDHFFTRFDNRNLCTRYPVQVTHKKAVGRPLKTRVIETIPYGPSACYTSKRTHRLTFRIAYPKIRWFPRCQRACETPEDTLSIGGKKGVESVIVQRLARERMACGEGDFLFPSEVYHGDLVSSVDLIRPL